MGPRTADRSEVCPGPGSSLRSPRDHNSGLRWKGLSERNPNAFMEAGRIRGVLLPPSPHPPRLGKPGLSSPARTPLPPSPAPRKLPRPLRRAQRPRQRIVTHPHALQTLAWSGGAKNFSSLGLGRRWPCARLPALSPCARRQIGSGPAAGRAGGEDGRLPGDSGPARLQAVGEAGGQGPRLWIGGSHCSGHLPRRAGPAAHFSLVDWEGS